MLLAIDTSTAQIGLALYDGVQVPGELVWRSGLHHTQELAPALAELLRQVELEMDAVTALGVALGPGSFTSLRVGLAFAKGLVLATFRSSAYPPWTWSPPRSRPRTVRWRPFYRPDAAGWQWVGTRLVRMAGRLKVWPR
jgi:hypothetical protein